MKQNNRSSSLNQSSSKPSHPYIGDGIKTGCIITGALAGVCHVVNEITTFTIPYDTAMGVILDSNIIGYGVGLVTYGAVYQAQKNKRGITNARDRAYKTADMLQYFTAAAALLYMVGSGDGDNTAPSNADQITNQKTMFIDNDRSTTQRSIGHDDLNMDEKTVSYTDALDLSF